MNKRDSFLNKIFTHNEIDYIKNKNYNDKTVAGLFAAKEAISKVIGTGIGHLNWKDIEILHDKMGKPLVSINKLKFDDNDYVHIIEVSISHEKEYAISFALGYSEERISIPKEIKEILPKRKLNSHKGNYGRVGIIGGQKGMIGSIYLASNAALRCGSGLVYIIASKDIEDIISIKSTEAIVRSVDSIDEYLDMIKDLDGICIGPGFGVDENKKNIVKRILKDFHKPVVLDADGINCIKEEPEILLERKGPTILTPHPGELSNLLNISVEEIQNNRIYYSKYTSDKYNVISILKGYETVIAHRDNLYINKTGNPGMATAGSGDILSGMIISLICQGIDPYNSSILGTFAHGLSGDLAKLEKGEYGLIASDILNMIPKALINIAQK